MVRMRPPAALPAHLASAPFTVYEARAAALGGSRLRASDLATAGRLLYLPAGWEFELRGLARALSAATPGAWISHLTAAVLLGLWLPPWFRGCRELHLSKPKALPPVRRRAWWGIPSWRSTTSSWSGTASGCQRLPGPGWTLPASCRWRISWHWATSWCGSPAWSWRAARSRGRRFPSCGRCSRGTRSSRES